MRDRNGKVTIIKIEHENSLDPGQGIQSITQPMTNDITNAESIRKNEGIISHIF